MKCTIQEYVIYTCHRCLKWINMKGFVPKWNIHDLHQMMPSVLHWTVAWKGTNVIDDINSSSFLFKYPVKTWQHEHEPVRTTAGPWDWSSYMEISHLVGGNKDSLLFSLLSIPVCLHPPLITKLFFFCQVVANVIPIVWVLLQQRNFALCSGRPTSFRAFIYHIEKSHFSATWLLLFTLVLFLW